MSDRPVVVSAIEAATVAALAFEGLEKGVVYEAIKLLAFDLLMRVPAEARDDACLAFVTDVCRGVMDASPSTERAN